MKLPTLFIVVSFLPVLISATQCRGDLGAISEEGDGATGRVERIDVGGRKLTLKTQGQGALTIVIEAGSGLAAVESDEWKVVCDELAKSYTVCTYDRAGLGTSDPPAGTPRVAADIAQDLHTLLTNARVPTPYILVGHSMGGLFALKHAAAFPADAAGVVLVDSAHVDQDARWLDLIPAQTEGEDPSLEQARTFLRTRLEDRGAGGERIDMLAVRDEVRAVQSLGDRPLAVLTHSPRWVMVPELPSELMGAIEAKTQELQATFTRLSSNSSHRIAERAGHAIHVEDPQLVIAAVHEVAGKVKAQAVAK
jgi:pimeloyl-ACP methyl ester carboxylesterase